MHQTELQDHANNLIWRIFLIFAQGLRYPAFKFRIFLGFPKVHKKLEFFILALRRPPLKSNFNGGLFYDIFCIVPGTLENGLGFSKSALIFA
jgi:hypothetical protein